MKTICAMRDDKDTDGKDARDQEKIDTSYVM
jgi:hypothetical protein